MLTLVLGALALLLACTPSDVPSFSQVTDSAGVALVVGPSADQPLNWTFEEITRFGGADTGAASFTNASRHTVRTDGMGRIAVLERTDDGWVHLFDSTGSVLWSAGREGGGPGELQFPHTPAFGRDGEVTLLDAGRMALVTWDARGAFRTEAPWPADDGFPRGSVEVRGDSQYVSTEKLDTLARIVRLEMRSPRGISILDSVAGPKPAMVMLQCVGVAMAPLFTGELTWTLGEGLIATTTQTRYVIDVREGDRLVRSIRRDVPETAATVADVGRLYPDGMRVRFGGGSGCTIPSTEVAEKVGVAPTLPVIRAIALAPDGSLWVERYTFEGETPATDVFGADGQYLGTLTGTALPIGFLGTDRVVMPIKDATDGTSILGVYRIRRGD